jgi:hypothetical protein
MINKSIPEYVRVREEIAKELCMQSSLASELTEYQKCAYWEGIHETWREKYRKIADSILTIKGIAVLADEQKLPPALYSNKENVQSSFVEEAVKQDMLSANFKKVV